MLPGLRRRLGRKILSLLLLCLSVSVTGCSFSYISFRTDAGFRLLRPAQMSTVSLPFTITWQDPSFRKAGGPVQYGVFLDQHGLHPGETLRELVVNNWQDQVCRATKGCPDAAYLAQHLIYLTTKKSMTLTAVAATNRPGVPNLHHVQIVGFDAHLRRISESYLWLDFLVRTGVNG